MATMTQTLETPANPISKSNYHQEGNIKIPSISLYEQSREERIKENLERLQKLGIGNLSLQLKSLTPVSGRRKNLTDRKAYQRSLPVLPSEPTRRSSRLQNITPVSYLEEPRAKWGVKGEDTPLVKRVRDFTRDIVVKGPEIYTEEHEKLLGNTERNWELFVDGCGKDGKRIYDQVNGKTCHQCRQKTLGYRTSCCRCNMVQGQFCGDCLYMRYGEHVLEALENPDWLCPVCRGICNCSLCRQARGWPPTGALYRRITKLGFKSVAHYLMQTRHAETKLEQNQNDAVNQVSVKRSLPFVDVKTVLKDSLDINDNKVGENIASELTQCSEKKLGISVDAKQASAKRSLPFSDVEPLAKESLEINDDKVGLVKYEYEGKMGNEIEVGVGKEKEQNQINIVEPLPKESHAINDEEVGLLKSVPECKVGNEAGIVVEKEKEQYQVKTENGSLTKRKCKRVVSHEPSPDSIGGRLKQRRQKEDDHLEDLIGETEKILEIKEDLVLNIEEKLQSKKMKLVLTTIPSPDSIGGRLRQRRLNSSAMKMEMPNI